MSSLHPTLQLQNPVIQSYGPAGFKIAQVEYASSVLVTREAVTPISVTQFSEITLELLAPLVASEPPLEVLLIGGGATHPLMPEELRRQLRSAGLNPDVMSTGAACRTFNILLSEERRVAGLFIKPE